MIIVIIQILIYILFNQYLLILLIYLDWDWYQSLIPDPQLLFNLFIKINIIILIININGFLYWKL